MTKDECGMTNAIWSRAAKLADDLHDEGFNAFDRLSVTTLSLGMQVVFQKRDDKSTAEVEETAVRLLRRIIRIMHQAREASLPGR